MLGLVLNLVRFVKEIKVFIPFINSSFYKCLEYRPFKPQNIQLGQDTLKPTEHVLLEDDTFEQDYCLEDLFAHEDTIDSHSRKRVRINDIEDEDEVRFVYLKNQVKYLKNL